MSEHILKQVAALPYRRAGADLEILLVTSRRTARWIVPKGWPIGGLSDPDAAAREAYEEAGALGKVGRDPIGVFSYTKQARGEMAIANFAVTVYPLRVDRQLASWPEANQRKCAWFSAVRAQVMIVNSELAEIVKAFADGMRD